MFSTGIWLCTSVRGKSKGASEQVNYIHLSVRSLHALWIAISLCTLASSKTFICPHYVTDGVGVPDKHWPLHFSDSWQESVNKLCLTWKQETHTLKVSGHPSQLWVHWRWINTKCNQPITVYQITQPPNGKTNIVN